ncbi:MAG: hypothetical protein QM530_04880 [Phycisphaerales bacterium]|nr:hypothetical protein [Phycisphaerales bacterium]
MELTKIDYHVSFVGFTADELDTIYVSKYAPGGNFDTLKSIDTLMGLSISFTNDTSNTLLTGGYYNDCKIGFASSNVEFYLKDPVYPSPMKYESYGCGRSSVRPPYSITVNNHSQSINELSTNWGYLFLKKY